MKECKMKLKTKYYATSFRSYRLSKSQRNMNIFIHVFIGFHANHSDYTDTDSLCFENKHWDKLEAAGLVGNIFLQETNMIEMETYSMVWF